MAYQIPQQLEYKEKIMFGLTFKQLVYALIFGLISLIFFKVIGNPLIKYIFIIISSGIGISFIFLNLETYLRNYFIYFKNRKINVFENQLYSFLGVKSVENNIIITIKDKKIAIIKIIPINFSIKQEEEKEGIMLSFQKFLNSIDFPTQILINTESLELDEYLSSLKSRLKGEEFKEIFQKYKNFLHQVINNKKIMNRVFYLIVPEQSDIEIQVNICFDRFSALNLKAERLKNYELKNFLIKLLPDKLKEENDEKVDKKKN